MQPFCWFRKKAGSIRGHATVVESVGAAEQADS